MSVPRLSMRGVTKRFGATTALDQVDLEVLPGEIHGLVGENGAGKSTLMKILSGALRPDAGTMELDGRPWAPAGPAAGRAGGVAMIYQELSIAPHLSVAENIVLGAEPRRGPFVALRTARATAQAALARLGRSDLPLDARAGSLSVAGQQIVEIARAVALGARLLVLDEPTSSLSARDVERLAALARELRAGGCSIVWISHFLDEITALTDRCTVLRDGRAVGSWSTCDVDTAELVEHMVGRRVADLAPRSRRTPGDVVLEFEALAGRKLPAEATLRLRRGEVVGIAGLVGAGRTELLRSLFGLDPVREGQVRVGTCASHATPHRRWRQSLGMVSEDRKGEGLALDLSIAENLTLAATPALPTPRWRRRAAQPFVERLGIRCRDPDQPVGQLSGGNQQKVALARLLHADVDVLLLDEPTRGVDIGARAEIYRLIDALACGQGGRRPKAVLIVSSYFPELLLVCDRIAVMCRGRLGAARPVADVDERSLMLEATGAVGPTP